jgi:D-beta-D-heptose 7-phosphate kinase/D-beta-D-heptose 1-phosphate adenosyltransferase
MLNKSSISFKDIIEGSKVICKKNNHEMVVVTLGAEGMFSYESDGKSFKLDALKVNSVDVSGAGDTAISYLAVGVASGMSLEETLILANTAAGKKITKKGAVPVSYIELLSLSKRVEIEQIGLLKQVLNDKKIVFTNGCFDLLHAGHIYSLTQAKQLGDVLVVGVNSDESVRRLKGNTRPVIKLEERLQMLQALSCVDYVISFDEDTPQKIINELSPQILVKGSDYADKIVIGADIVRAYGGIVKFIDLYEDFSTSNIVKKIKES